MNQNYIPMSRKLLFLDLSNIRLKEEQIVLASPHILSSLRSFNGILIIITHFSSNNESKSIKRTLSI